MRANLAPSQHAVPAKPAGRTPALAWMDALAATAPIEGMPLRILPSVIWEIAQSQPGAPALLSDRETFDFGTLAGRINRYARWAWANGIGKGETVCLLMPNRPDYIAIWLGIAAAGGVTALLNTSLTGASLARCIEIAGARHIIVDSRCADAFQSARPHLANSTHRVWNYEGEAADATRIDLVIESFDDGPLAESERHAAGLDDRALLIYTSGTTGLPKAANVSHRRVMNWAFWFRGMLGMNASDRMYDCLPLYHSVGGVVAVASTLAAGGSVVIAEKFSASRFWDDMVRWDCTLFQYIGELCRYLLKSPEGAARGHRLRAICGNGLRGDVWVPFQERFAIPRILEFYAATEGTFSLYNVEGKPGSIGRIPPFLRHRFPAAIVAHDRETGEPARGEDGLCIAVRPGETGEAIGRIGAGTRFEGYTSKAESDRKILRDVFEPGDRWFRTGDLMRTDAAGYYYFIDRIGDTFRWKGENVSTAEVSSALMTCPGVAEAVVYGVAVPATEGRAGMAKLVVDETFDLQIFARHARSALPTYAVPLFLRIGETVPITETFKHKTQDLVLAGFDPALAAEPLYVADPQSARYIPIDANLHSLICSGRMRL
ncbi:long-chain-acyl-CoA synthetase [soil metagenome]